jgi:hypothetical protein
MSLLPYLGMFVSAVQISTYVLKSSIKDPAKTTANIYGTYISKKWAAPSSEMDANKHGNTYVKNLKQLVTRLDKPNYPEIEALGKTTVFIREQNYDMIAATIILTILFLSLYYYNMWVNMSLAILSYLFCLITNKPHMFVEMGGVLLIDSYLMMATQLVIIQLSNLLTGQLYKYTSAITSGPLTLITSFWKLLQ